MVFSGMVTAASMVAASINQRIHKYLLNYQTNISVRYQLSFKSNLLYLPKLYKPLSKCIFTTVLMYKPLVVFKFTRELQIIQSVQNIRNCKAAVDTVRVRKQLLFNLQRHRSFIFACSFLNWRFPGEPPFGSSLTSHTAKIGIYFGIQSGK